MKRSVWQVVAGRIARVFGIRFYDMYYGHRNLFPPVAPVSPSVPYEVRLANSTDLDKIVSLIGGKTRKDFNHNIAIRSSCYIAIHDVSVAGYLWVNQRIVDLAGMYLAKLPPRHAFSHNAFVFPEYRGKKIYQQLRAAVCSEMYKSGCVSVACLVDKANIRSIHVLRQEGIEFHGAGILKLPGIKPILFCRALA